MGAIKDLKLGKDVIATGGWEDLPEQIGTRRKPLQPGPYRFTFPVASKVNECFDTMETTIDGKAAVRVVAIHRDGAELTVEQAPKRYEDRVGEPFPTRISNAERKRGKGDDAPKASDMDYVLLTLQAKSRPQTNRQYLEVYAATVPEKSFGADIEWNWGCSDKRNVRVADPDATSEFPKTIELDGQEGREQRAGCGRRYYQKDITADMKTDGEYPRTIDCECGAVLFANENLSNFRK